MAMALFLGLALFLLTVPHSFASHQEKSELVVKSAKLQSRFLSSDDLGPASAPAPDLAAPAPAPDLDTDYGPSPSPEAEDPEPEAGSPSPSEGPPPTSPVPPSQANASTTITWCAVGNEIADCQLYLKALNSEDGYEWSCIERDTKSACMQAIKDKNADLISLDAGLAYIAFRNYSMKAIMAEEYCYHLQSYYAVAVVPKQLCDQKPDLALRDLKGLKSCHAGYSTAAGWNYPVGFMVNSSLQFPTKPNSSMGKDEDIVSSFFSASCAISDIEGKGLCSGCSDNCSSNSVYAGHVGAFRCLMDGLGDISFLRSGITQLYASDGFKNQSWSSMSTDEVMYLCPTGGCRAISENPGSCTFGRVPSNVIMARNSLPEKKRVAVINALSSAKWAYALYTGENWAEHLLSSSVQSLAEVTKLTKDFLGESALISQAVTNITDFSLRQKSDALRPSTSMLVIVSIAIIYMRL